MDEMIKAIAEAKASAVREKLDKLATLGTADAIAMELEAQGIKAQRKDAYSCAIAKYLNPQNERFGVDAVGVTSCYTMVHTSKRAEVDHVSNPSVVQEFIGNFDRGVYPALIAPPEPRDAA